MLPNRHLSMEEEAHCSGDHEKYGSLLAPCPLLSLLNLNGERWAPWGMEPLNKDSENRTDIQLDKFQPHPQS